MFTDTISIYDLHAMLLPHMDKPAWPELDTPAARQRSIRIAKQLDIWQSLPHGLNDQAQAYAREHKLWDELPADFDPSATLPVIRHSYRTHVKTTGLRGRIEAALRQRYYAMTSAALAIWLKHPSADIELLEDLLWAWCETGQWSRIGGMVDLHSSMLAADMAEFLWMFDSQLNDEVKDYVSSTIEERVLGPACDYHLDNWWSTCRHNWNSVVISNLISAACYLFKDAMSLAYYLHPLIENLKYGLEGYTEDGGCSEGPGYWHYGFDHFLDAAIILKQKTGGSLDLVGQNEKIKRICLYPLAAYLENDVCTCWSDAEHGWVPARILFKINRYFNLPELFTLCQRDSKGNVMADDFDGYRLWRTLTMYRNIKPGRNAVLRDAHLPDLGQAKLYAPKAKARTALAVTATHNGFNHNHNDIGSFIYYRGGTCLLTDPGAEIYTNKTFGPHRYESIFNNSFGHSVPVINNTLQSPGAERYGVLSVSGLESEGEKRFDIDMTRAYDVKTLVSLQRALVLSPQGKASLNDSFCFRRQPRSVEEAFITYETARLSPQKDRVTIGKGKNKVVLRALETDGEFALQRLEEESKKGRRSGTITRIVFTPAHLACEMTLSFQIG